MTEKRQPSGGLWEKAIVADAMNRVGLEKIWTALKAGLDLSDRADLELSAALLRDLPDIEGFERSLAEAEHCASESNNSFHVFRGTAAGWVAVAAWSEDLDDPWTALGHIESLGSWEIEPNGTLTFSMGDYGVCVDAAFGTRVLEYRFPALDVG